MLDHAFSIRRLIVLLVLIPAAWLGTFAAGGAWGSIAPATDQEDDILACGQPLVVESADGRTFAGESTRVVLALDEAWRERYGKRAEDAARSLLVSVSGLFRGLHIHLLPVRTDSWVAPAGVDAAGDLIDAARSAISLEGADIVVALTGRKLSPQDGWAPVGGRYAVVGHHPDRPERDAFVLAHEIAHLFGATHGCDLSEHEGVMAQRGFEEPDLLCPCTRQVLEMNANRFHVR